MDNVIQEWLQASEYDLKTAEAMLKTGRYLYVVFMCQQALEKLLKAIYCRKKNELSLRTHNLLYLADVLELEVTDADKILLSKLNQFYIETRYPQERSRLTKEMNKIKAGGYLAETKKEWKCLRRMLP